MPVLQRWKKSFSIKNQIERYPNMQSRLTLRLIKRAALLLLLSTLNPQLSTVHAQGTAFTYQGRLNDGVNPAGGIYDLRFTIYDSTNQPGTVISGPVTDSATAV